MYYSTTQAQKKQLKEKYRVVYTPKGAAREYSELAVNIATGCEHGCLYCYAPSLRKMTREDYQKNIQFRSQFLEKLELDLQEMQRLADDRRVLLCFMTDPYQPALADYTRECLERFRYYDIAFQVLTKNGALAQNDFDLYSSKDAYAATVVFADDKIRQLYEPYAGTIEERVESLKLAHDMGIETWVSLEPVMFPEEAFKVIDLTNDYVGKYKIGKITKFSYPGSDDIDWREFTLGIMQKLDKMGKDYYIKNSLRQYL